MRRLTKSAGLPADAFPPPHPSAGLDPGAWFLPPTQAPGSPLFLMSQAWLRKCPSKWPRAQWPSRSQHPLN
jgi:hypothetical protein